MLNTVVSFIPAKTEWALAPPVLVLDQGCQRDDSQPIFPPLSLFQKNIFIQNARKIFFSKNNCPTKF